MLMCVTIHVLLECKHVKTEENVLHDLEWNKEIQKQKNCIKLDDVGISHSRGRENINQSPAKAEEETKRSGNQAIPKWRGKNLRDPRRDVFLSLNWAEEYIFFNL